jgi:hypothetical protein
VPRVSIGPALLDRKQLDVEIARLRDLDITALRNRWYTVLGRPAPPHLPRHLLFRILAYRVQADRDPAVCAEMIAKREGCSARKVNMTISLAFLAPDLIKAAIEGRLPHGIGTTRLTDLPAEWSRQHAMLGLQ